MNRAQENGFTLVELLIVLVILVMAAATAAPLFKTAVEEKKLDAAFAEVFSAAEFARGEARRTREPTGFCVDALERLVVLKMAQPNADETTNAAWDFAIPHPIDKQAYQVEFANSPHLEGVELVFISSIQTPFYFEGVVAGSECVYFDSDGKPFISSTGGNQYRLSNSWIKLQLVAGTNVIASREMRIQPLSGLPLEI